MLERLNIFVIVRDHIRTFYSYRNRIRTPGSTDLRKGEILGHLGLPAVITVLLWRSNVILPETSLGTLITALSVFGALLFNLLILLYDVSGREPRDSLPEVVRARKQTLLDLHANVAFAVFLTLVSIVDLVIAAIGEKGQETLPTSLAFFYLGSLFILTLLMILRRMHMLLSSDITRD